MVEPNEGDVALACMSVLVDELARGGVPGASVSPGSRSAPIALALARHGGVPVHVHLDERSSGFFAVGLAKATGRPAVVACTSGTAVANLFPAVVEAFHSRTPLILLTADRPPELRGTGANQTIDQLRIFGGFARFVDAGVPQAGQHAGLYWRSLGARAIAASMGPPAGPVHLNLPFREPLVPTGATVALGPDAAGRAGGEPRGSTGEASWIPDPDVVGAFTEMVGATERGVVLAGTLDRPAPAVGELAERAAWPLVAEPASGLRRPREALGQAQHLLADNEFVESARPDVVLQFGASPTTRASQALVARAERLVVSAADPAGSDPTRSAGWSIRCDPQALAASANRTIPPRAETGWLRRWRWADHAAGEAVNALLDSWDEPFEGRLARDLPAWMPGGSVLMVGSSTPVRDLDAFMPPTEAVRVIGNRGASGIDGFVSTVLGVSATGSPTYALTGDLSLLHDIGGLIWSAGRGYRAVIVVANNRGGGVFDLLPQVRLPEHDRLFVTPHDVDLEGLATAAGASHTKVDRAGDLAVTLEKATAGEGIWIVEVPIDRTSAVERRGQIRESVHRAVHGL